MATVTDRLAILITAHGSQATGEVQKLSGAFGKLSTAHLAAGAAALGVGKFMLDAAEKTSALTEQVSANAAIFGKASASIRQFSETSANGFGLSARAALQGTNAIGGLFKQAGLAQQPAADLSVATVKLAGDLASFRDVIGGAPEVLEKLRSGLTGEVEPLRNLGVFLNDASVRAKAVELGLAQVHGEVDDGAKILARYALIIDQTKDAQGDMARTSGSLANQQRAAAAAYEDAQARFGRSTIKLKTGFLRMGIGILDFADDLGAGISEVLRLEDKAAQSTVANAATSQAAARQQREYAESTRLLAQRQKENAAALDLASKAQQTATKSAREHRDAIVRVTDSQRSAAAVQRDEIEAREELAELEARGRVDKEAVAQATERHAAASRASEDALRGEARAAKEVESANKDVADALAEVEKIRKGASPRDLKEAELDHRDAVRDRERALKDIKKTEQDLLGFTTVGILKDGEKAKTTEDKADAEDDLAEKRDAAERATFRVEDAEKRLKDTREKGKPGSKELQDALDVLAQKQETAAQRVQDHADAQQNVNDRKADAVKAHDELRKAEEGDPEWDEKLRDLRQQVADAEYDVAKAKRESSDATEDLNAKEAAAAKDRAARLTALQGVMGPVAGRTSASSSVNGLDTVMGPVLGRASRSSSAVLDTDKFMGPVLGRNGLNSTINNITVFTGADANAVQNAIERYASQNGGKPRK